ncbi:MAG TPA: hypothetical protein VH374_02385 [Polyangia bacterium]|jgi:hypothetical protein|nr:hypothetical protein [Polyangia bacterium]
MNLNLRFAIVGVAATALCGCAGSIKNMSPVANVNTAAGPQEAVVVFLRPSGMAFGVQSELFEINQGQPAQLVGIVAAKKKIAYRTTPGPHMFMVIGESADFMEAHLNGGQTYYAVVTPRMGGWKARFSMRPLLPAEPAKLPAWLQEGEWTALNQDSARWAAENAVDVESKRAKYMPQWLAKPPTERPLLDR